MMDYSREAGNPCVPQVISVFTPDASAARRSIESLLVLSVICFAYCVWILSLPLFPTQDGPVHLYFAHVLQALLFHGDPGIYPRFYIVKHVLPPYAMYYYMLLLLGQVVTLITAEKLVVCLYIVLFLFGFRYLARSIGPAGDTAALFATPLVLNWPLGMGFINFCLSTALAFFALGLWISVTNRSAASYVRVRLFGFVALCGVIMLTHPVPLLFVLGFTAVDLTVRLLQSRYRGSAHLALAGIAWVLAASTLFYVHAFAGGNVFLQTAANDGPYLLTILHNAPAMLLLKTLTIFAGSSILDVIYRGAILFIVLLGFVLGRRDLYRSQQARRWSVANTWFVLGVALALALPFVPPDLNGSHFFAARLVLYVWVALLAASSGSSPEAGDTTYRAAMHRTWFHRGAAAFSLAIAGVTLLLGEQRIRPLAMQITAIESANLPYTHRVALMLNGERYAGPATLNFDPYRWSGIRILRRTDSVLYNTPWLDLAIIPLGPQPTMPTGKIAALSLEYVPHLRRDLLTSATARNLVFPAIDMTIVNHGTVDFDHMPDSVLTADPIPERRWTCAAESMYSLCTAIK